MSVIGIDFGYESCYIAVARQGGIETIANDYSLRATASCVAFGEKTRILGVAAKNQMLTNMKNTCYGFKPLVGRHYRDPRVQKEMASLPYHIKELHDGKIGISVRYLNEEHNFTPTQISAMLLTKLKLTAESALGIKVNDCVIGVPCYFTDGERRAMLEAAVAAGLNVLRLFNETTATALAYGIYKQDLPGPEEKPRNVVFLDCGSSTLQVSASAFNKGKLKMLASAADPNLGGRDFDHVLAMFFAEDFKKRYKIDACQNPRAWQRLLTEVEKVKKQMSANSTDLPLNIECFMDDKDVSGKINRVTFEELSCGILQKVEKLLKQVLHDSSLKLDDIYSVEIVGGSSRVPSIKQLIEKVYHKTPSTTLNQDEAVARGCALQCAMLSPAFKVREFAVSDVQPYSIRLVWQDDAGQEAEMEVFPKNHQVPFSKLLTFFRREPFVLQAQYSSPSPCSDPIIGNFTIQKVTPDSEGLSQKVKIKVRVNLHGLFTVASASLTEKKEQFEEPPEQSMEMEDKQKASDDKKNDENTQQDQSATHSEGTTEEQPAENEEKKLKKVLKTVDLPIVEAVKALGPNDLHSLVEKEAQMVAADKLENERINAKNAVEEYVYELRSKIYEELERYISAEDREKLSRQLEEMENWLYEEGEDCHKQIYIDQLLDLKKNGEPIKDRRRDREELPLAFENLLSAVLRARKVVDLFKQGNEAYNHLDAAEMEKVEQAIHEKQDWVDKNLGLVNSTPLHLNLPIVSNQVRSEKNVFESLVNPIINKSKPKPKVEEPPPVETEGNDKNENDNVHNGPNPEDQSTKDKPRQDEMDVD